MGGVAERFAETSDELPRRARAPPRARWRARSSAPCRASSRRCLRPRPRCTPEARRCASRTSGPSCAATRHQRPRAWTAGLEQLGHARQIAAERDDVGVGPGEERLEQLLEGAGGAARASSRPAVFGFLSSCMRMSSRLPGGLARKRRSPRVPMNVRGQLEQREVVFVGVLRGEHDRDRTPWARP